MLVPPTRIDRTARTCTCESLSLSSSSSSSSCCCCCCLSVCCLLLAAATRLASSSSAAVASFLLRHCCLLVRFFQEVQAKGLRSQNFRRTLVSSKGGTLTQYWNSVCMLKKKRNRRKHDQELVSFRATDFARGPWPQTHIMKKREPDFSIFWALCSSFWDLSPAAGAATSRLLPPPPPAATTVLCTVTQIDAFSNSRDRNAQEFVAMLSRILVFSACLCAVLALPLPTSDACKHCLFIHPFQKDNIAYCQAQNACPVHDDAAVSNVILKVDPATVPFNTSMATLGRFPFLPFFSLLFAFGLHAPSASIPSRLFRVPLFLTLLMPDFSLNFTVTNATGTGQIAVKIFTPLDEASVPFAQHNRQHVVVV